MHSARDASFIFYYFLSLYQHTCIIILCMAKLCMTPSVESVFCRLHLLFCIHTFSLFHFFRRLLFRLSRYGSLLFTADASRIDRVDMGRCFSRLMPPERLDNYDNYDYPSPLKKRSRQDSGGIRTADPSVG